MSRSTPSKSGVVIIASVYIYFLIFAQFAFLRLVQTDGLGTIQIRLVMGAMAVAGVATSLTVSRFCLSAENLRRLLLIGFSLCGLASLASLQGHGMMPRCGVSALIGAGLGIVTVGASASTPLWFPHRSRGTLIGLGTGLAYAFCNIPAVFAGEPATQALIATGLSVAGIVATLATRPQAGNSEELESPKEASGGGSFSALLVAFLALVWLDSAAFFILQSTPELNRFGWATSGLQLSNALIHFAAAFISGRWLDRGGIRPALLTAFGFLVAAALLVSSHHQFAAEATHWFYAAGVSLYSTALVFAPAEGRWRPLSANAKRAGILYAIAGWIGSALGIGMAQDLHQIPGWFLWIAGSLLGAGLIPALGAGASRTRKLKFLNSRDANTGV